MSPYFVYLLLWMPPDCFIFSVQNFEKITCHVQSKNKDQVLVIDGLLLES